MSAAVEVFRVPSDYSIRQLIYAVHHAKTHPHALYLCTSVFPERDMTSPDFIRWFRLCLSRKINSHDPLHEPCTRWRKRGADGYLSQWEADAYRTARAVNTPRLIVRVSEVPVAFRDRLAHRLSRPEDLI